MAQKSAKPCNTWTKEEIKERLLSSDDWLYRGLMAIYNHQTDSEQAAMATSEDNGIGFNGVDAFILSKFAEDYKKYQRLTPKQLALTRKKMIKYAGQLAKIAKPKPQKEINHA